MNNKKYNVIIAEDEPPSKDLIQLHVESRNDLNIIDIVEDGKDVLAKLNNSEVNCDLILLDVNLAGMSGIEILNKLKLFEKKPYVIFTTAYNEFEVDYDSCHFLLKPIPKNRFDDSIKKFIENNK